MLKFEEIFNDALSVIPSYPVTLFNLIFAPKKVFAPSDQDLVCTPGVTLGVSFLLLGAGAFYRAGALKPEAMSHLVGTVAISLFVWVAIGSIGIAAIQAALLRRMFDPKAKTTGGKPNLLVSTSTLSYPLATILPLAPFLVSFDAVLAASDPARGFVDAPSVSATLADVVLYGPYTWVAFNVVRETFEVDVRRAALGAILATTVLSASVVVVAVFLGLY